MIELIGAGIMGGGIIVSKLMDMALPFNWTPQGRLFKAQKKWQGELEEQRMNFQERLEAKRLRCQENIEKQRSELQKYLAEQGMKNNREIALFQARAMRQTQMLLAQENARNVLKTTLMQDALKTFPLNVSPMVLLSNQSHSMGHLLHFSEDKGVNQTTVQQVYEEVEAARRHPDALNVFVAPIHIDSKIKNRKVLSDQIWDTVYQKIESFFTQHYNRSSDHPVIFYPTAWNDKYNPGMHASETLHFFLKDLPCIVIEPRFDGNTFRMMFSSWGLGYNSSIHHRTELNFDINIDIVLANSVYERSLKALNLIRKLENVELSKEEKIPFSLQARIYERNIKLYEALELEKRIKNKQMEDIEALGIYNIFKIEPLQDLAPLAEYLSSYIGLNLSVLADIHHLRSSDANPLLPQLLKGYFPSVYRDKDMRALLFQEYKEAYSWLRKEERMLETTDSNEALAIRNTQELCVKEQLELVEQNEVQSEIERIIRGIVKDKFGYESENFDLVWNICMTEISMKEKPLFEEVLPQIKDSKRHRELERILSKLR